MGMGESDMVTVYWVSNVQSCMVGLAWFGDGKGGVYGMDHGGWRGMEDERSMRGLGMEISRRRVWRGTFREGCLEGEISRRWRGKRLG